MKYFCITLIALIMLASCSDNKKQLTFKVSVLDSATKKPIPDAKVTLLCWRKVDFDDETYDKVDTTTDSKGQFTVRFAEGFKTDLASVADGYYIGYKQLGKVQSGNNAIQIELVPTKEAGAVSKQQLALFFRYGTDKNNPAAYGIDFLNGKSGTNKDRLDIWPVEADKNLYPLVIVAHEQGGVVPIFENLSGTQGNIAPTEGYLKRYKLTGKEVGFFVRCRDGKTYCRLNKFGNNFQVSSPSPEGVYEDYGLMFNVILKPGGSTNLNIGVEVDLEKFILEKI